jgi:hypothetical protein
MRERVLLDAFRSAHARALIKPLDYVKLAAIELKIRSVSFCREQKFN